MAFINFSRTPLTVLSVLGDASRRTVPATAVQARPVDRPARSRFGLRGGSRA